MRSRAYDTTDDLGGESLIPFTDFLRVVASAPNTEWVVDRTGWSAGRRLQGPDLGILAGVAGFWIVFRV